MNSLMLELISKCGDSEFKDFQEPIYDRAIQKANRTIARKYELINKVYEFEVDSGNEDLEFASTENDDGDVTIELDQYSKRYNNITVGELEQTIRFAKDIILEDLQDFDNEYLVTVNNIPFLKATHRIQKPNYYLLEKVMNIGYASLSSPGELSFNYFPRSAGDKITICYTTIPNLDIEGTDYIIPDKFKEEQINQAVFYIAEMGLAKFVAGEKLDKYTRLYKMYKGGDQKNPELVTKKEWIQMKIHQPF